MSTKEKEKDKKVLKKVANKQILRKKHKHKEIEEKEKNKEDVSETNGAVDKVEDYGRRSTNEVTHQTMYAAKRAYEKVVIEKQIIKERKKDTVIKEQINPDRIHTNPIEDKRRNVTKKCAIDDKIKNRKEKYISIQKRMNVVEQIKKKKIADEKGIIHNSKNIVDKGYQAVKWTVNKTKKAISSLPFLYSCVSGFILLTVFVLFIGVFSSLFSGSAINAEIRPLSKEVLDMSSTITKYAKEYKVEEYVPIIQAIMMQESEGKGSDPMQASECQFNEKYPKVKDGIKDREYSVMVGVRYFFECIKLSSTENQMDTENLYLAIQAYNYGTEYIEWANKHFGGYTKSNAKVYADNKRNELHMETYGDINYVEHVMQYVTSVFRSNIDPNFNNIEAWGTNNPYTQAKLFGQCTWFAWGRFYELYGYSPGFTGNGWDCAKELVKAHPDKFELSEKPKAGAIFSCKNRNHVGIVIAYDGKEITIQEGNLDGKTNTFQEAKKDWRTKKFTLREFMTYTTGVIYAAPK